MGKPKTWQHGSSSKTWLNQEKNNNSEQGGLIWSLFFWDIAPRYWVIGADVLDSVVVPSSKALSPIKNAEFLQCITLHLCPLLHVTGISHNPGSAMPWYEGTNLHGFTMKTCCVIDTRTGIYINWHNRATTCVVMRKRIAKTGFKPELFTPSSELAQNYRYSEFSYVAGLTKLQYCQAGRSSDNSSSLMTNHCDADVQLCCAGTDHSAVISNKFITNIHLLLARMLQDEIFTWCTKQGPSNRVMHI